MNSDGKHKVFHIFLKKADMMDFLLDLPPSRLKNMLMLQLRLEELYDK